MYICMHVIFLLQPLKYLLAYVFHFFTTLFNVDRTESVMLHVCISMTSVVYTSAIYQAKCTLRIYVLFQSGLQFLLAAHTSALDSPFGRHCALQSILFSYFCGFSLLDGSQKGHLVCKFGFDKTTTN